MEFWLRLCIVGLLQVLSSQTDNNPSQTDQIHITASLNSEVVLPCQIDNVVPDHMVVWMDPESTVLTMDDRRIYNNPRVSVDRPTVSEWNLRLSDVGFNDQGEYTCISRTRDHTLQIKTVILTVEDENAVAPQPAVVNVTANLNTVAILPCYLENVGANHVIWVDSENTLITFNDMRFIDNSRISIERPTMDQWNLRIENVQLEDAGEYNCRAGTNSSPYMYSKTVFLNVVDPEANP